MISDYCGVYATAMLLSLLGIPTNRQEARVLFGIRRSSGSYTGTELTELAGILRSTGRFSDVRWLFLKRFRFEAVASRLRRQLKATGRPTLLWYGVVCRGGTLRAFHIAVVVDVTQGGILLLDPLGRSPGNQPFNVSIRAELDEAPQRGVEGSFYQVDSTAAAGVLHWRLP